MGYDDDGASYNPRYGQQREAGQDEERVGEADGIGHSEPNSRNRDDGLEEVFEDEASKVAIAIARSWSGMLPPPEDFREYDESVRDKIIEWTDARVLDESRRQDILVKAATRNAMFASIASFVVNMSIVVGAIVAFAVTNNPSVFWSFAIPGASIVGNIFINIKSAKKDSSD